MCKWKVYACVTHGQFTAIMKYAFQIRVQDYKYMSFYDVHRYTALYFEQVCFMHTKICTCASSMRMRAWTWPIHEDNEIYLTNSCSGRQIHVIPWFAWTYSPWFHAGVLNIHRCALGNCASCMRMRAWHMMNSCVCARDTCRIHADNGMYMLDSCSGLQIHLIPWCAHV